MSALDDVMGVNEAGQLWGLSPGYVKNLCKGGKVLARQIGNTWIIDKKQPNPSPRGSRSKEGQKENRGAME